jgi:hypothetical protein
MLGRPHSLSIFGKLERESLPRHKDTSPYDYGTASRVRDRRLFE